MSNIIETAIKSPRCLYHAHLADFIQTNDSQILGDITSSFHGDTQSTTIESWIEEIRLLKVQLNEWRSEEDAHIIFEYNIPRLGKRIDVVLLLRGIIFCLEFKVGKKEALQADMEQVLDYALDLKNFHLYSANQPIAPILVPTRYPGHSTVIQTSVYDDGIFNPMISGEEGIKEIISNILAHCCPVKVPDDYYKV